MAMRVEDGIRLLGDFFILLGTTSMVCVSIIAWILLIALLCKNNNNTPSEPIFFVFPSNCWGPSYAHDPYCGSRYGYHSYTLIDIAFFSLTSLIISAVVIGVAINMGLPSVALGLGVGWCAAFSMILLGLFTRTIGDAIERGNSAPTSTLGIFAPSANNATFIDAHPPIAAVLS